MKTNAFVRLKPVILASALAFVSAGMLAIAHPSPALAQQDDDGPAGEVDLETFYRELAPHGRWFEHRRYGTVWSPSVEEGWKPYSRGHWANTEEHGWYWVSEEEWGWAPFHYGRWAHDEDDGWFWVPGTTWGPAWVTWRSNDETIGWAPLPPDADWEPDGNLRFHASSYDTPRWAFVWNFVEPRYMFEPGLHWRLLPRGRAISIIRDTSPVHRYSFVNRRIYNHGIDFRRVERLANRPVPTVRLRFSSTHRDDGWRGMRDARELPVYRPRIVSRPDVERPPSRSRDGGLFGGRRWDWTGRSNDRPAPQPAPNTGRDGRDWRNDRDADRDGRDARSRDGRRNFDSGPQVSRERPAQTETVPPSRGFTPPNSDRSGRDDRDGRAREGRSNFEGAPQVSRERPTPSEVAPATTTRGVTAPPANQPATQPQGSQPFGGRRGDARGSETVTAPRPQPNAPATQPVPPQRPAGSAGDLPGRGGNAGETPGRGGRNGEGRGDRRRPEGTPDGQPRQ